MKITLWRSPFEGGQSIKPGDLFDYRKRGTVFHIPVRVVLPVEHRDGRWTVYAEKVGA